MMWLAFIPDGAKSRLTLAPHSASVATGQTPPSLYMTELIRFSVNGTSQSVSTDPQRSLLETLREELGLTGTKYGCGEGQCRACTVLLDGKPVQSCLTPVSLVKDRKVETIEGLSSGGELHSVQKAFIEEEGM